MTAKEGLSAQPLSREKVEELLHQSPFHQWLGIRVLEVSPTGIVLSATFRPEWIVRNPGGFIHGGILATLIDLTADWSLVSITGRGVPTLDLRVDYHRPAVGNLRAVGTIIKAGRRVSCAQAEIFDDEGRLVASGRGTYWTAPLAESKK